MAIIGKNAILGYGDVGISADVKFSGIDPTTRIRFYQLNSPHFEPCDENTDKSVPPVMIVVDLYGLELLHSMTGDLLKSIYQKQIQVLEKEKQRLQTQKV